PPCAFASLGGYGSRRGRLTGLGCPPRSADRLRFPPRSAFRLGLPAAVSFRAVVASRGRLSGWGCPPPSAFGRWLRALADRRGLLAAAHRLGIRLRLSLQVACRPGLPARSAHRRELIAAAG
ncbi:hypothetical protein AB0F43_26185, partial [Kribbella sp. NPDC023972]|uniref:hypothetical protein n=1 Tax=Kribbella sp. NPDC023972 TaxID=3154795 RepID=UPI0033F27776